ncbi:MAG: NUDIX hydrolase [Lautropia sp.]|nr:NUDIX hydrolase [Lautropia sp.]
MKYCSHCGNPTEQIIPEGDNRPRQVCPRCHTVHYVNPRIVTGAICVWEDKVLLCRRAIEPRHGKWTLPAGFMEIGESMAEGAQRETREEAGADAVIEQLYALLDVPHAEQVHVFYLARLRTPSLDPGEESLEARLFTEEDIPWAEIAFSTVAATLRWFFEDRRQGRYQLHEGQISRPAPGASAASEHPDRIASEVLPVHPAHSSFASRNGGD